MIDVLVVDDELKPAESFARFIEAETRLRTRATDDPNAAVQIVRENHVKVVVLDQRMPGVTGVELFSHMKKADPDLRAILFSGEAKKGEYSIAAHEGFVELVDKSDLEKLPALVKYHYAAYLADVAEAKYKNVERLSVRRTGFSFRGPKVTFDLMDIRDAPGDEKFIVLENQYETYLQLRAGETAQTTRTAAREFEVIVEHESQVKATLSAENEVKGAADGIAKFEISSRLKSSIEESLKHKYSERVKQNDEVVAANTYSLPAEAPGPLPYVVSRHYERAPVYERKRILVRTRCECCGTDQFDSFTVLVPVGKFRTRQTDYMSDNTTRTVATG